MNKATSEWANQAEALDELPSTFASNRDSTATENGKVWPTENENRIQ